MALDKEYFDAISIDLVKKKYYNANKVNAVLDDIRAQALAMTEELNTALCAVGRAQQPEGGDRRGGHVRAADIPGDR